jgi:hypothetical protein
LNLAFALFSPLRRPDPNSGCGSPNMQKNEINNKSLSSLSSLNNKSLIKMTLIEIVGV